MRLIGMGLLASLLAAIALFLSTSERLQLGLRALSEVVSGPQIQFETSPGDTIPARGRNAAAVTRANPDVPLILTGFPAYQGAVFHMPVDARPTAGYLQIDVTIQALSGVEGVLRVSIGNARRAELLLRPGEAGRSVRVELNEHDIARERLVVSFSLQGDGTHAPCGTDEGLEAIVEIETTSAVFLTLDAELETDQDHMLVAGHVAQLHWGEADQADSLLAGARLVQAGVAVRYDDDGLAPEAASRLALAMAPTATQPVSPWSEQFSPENTFFALREFRRAETWRLTYDMSSSTDRRLPQQLDLEMVLGQLPGGSDWQILVSLNGRLVHQSLTAEADFAASIALPAAHHRRENRIEITARSTYDPGGECAREPDIFAQIQPDTVMIPGNASFDGPLIQLIGQLESGWQFSTEGLNAAEALVLAELLAELPLEAATRAGGATVHALPRGTDLSGVALNTGSQWVVYWSETGNLTAQALDGFAQGPAPHALLLVSTGVGS